MCTIEERFSRLKNEELLEIVEKQFFDYTSEALEIAKNELGRRGINYVICDNDQENVILTLGKEKRMKTNRLWEKIISISSPGD